MENQDNKFNNTIDQNSNNRVVSSDEKTNKVEKISLDELNRAKAEMKGEATPSNQGTQENNKSQFDFFKDQLEKLRTENEKEKAQDEEPVKKSKFDWDSILPETKTEEPVKKSKFNWDSISTEKKDDSISSETKTEEPVKKSKFNWDSISLDVQNNAENDKNNSQEVQSSKANVSQTGDESDTQIVATVAGDHDFDKLHIKLQIDPDTNIGTILTDPEAIEKLKKQTEEKETKQEEKSSLVQEVDNTKIQIEKQETTSSVQEQSSNVDSKEEKTEKESLIVPNDEKEVETKENVEDEQTSTQKEVSEPTKLSAEKVEQTKNESSETMIDSNVSETQTNQAVEEKPVLEEKPVQQIQKISPEEIAKLRNELIGNKNNSNSSETQTTSLTNEQKTAKDENIETKDEQKTSEEQVQDRNIEQKSNPEIVQNQETKQENIEQVQENKSNEPVQNQSVEKEISSDQNHETQKIEPVVKNDNKPNIEKINKEDLLNDSDFEGMTDEEIVQEIERRKRLADLKQKYSEDNNKDPNDIGEYKKSLDFASNATIKQFKMRPPKKVVAITIISIFLAIAIAVATTLFVLKKPPEPAVLVSSRISQSKISHYVGDTIDLRGIYIEELYSDGSTKTVQVSDSMISEKSSNINNDLVVVELSENSYIRFTLNGKTQSLFVELDEMKMTKILSFEIYQDEIVAESKIKFDNILILAEIRNKNNVVVGSKRIRPQNATFKIEGQESNLETDNEGILLYKTDGSNKVTLDPGDYNLILTITENGTNFEYKTQIHISWVKKV